MLDHTRVADVKIDLISGMKLIAHDPIAGFGGIGEGMSLQKAPDGRRILWLAHEGPPKNFTGVDVTDPARPRVIVQTDLPHNRVRSNSLETSGNLMAVAYQTYEHGAQPAGIELFDISVPEHPRSVSFFDCSGPHSRGVHQVWFVDGEFVHCAAGAPDFTPRNPLDDQPYRIIDVRNPSKPVEAGRWWMPGTAEGDDAPPPPRLKIDTGIRCHNTNVYPARPDRAYVGYIDGGFFVMDVSDKSRPTVISRFSPNPPFPGFAHTLMPLFGRDLAVASHECIHDDGFDWPKLTWILDIRCEDNPVPLATLPMPSFDEYSRKGGRFGCHNLHENPPRETALHSETLLFSTLFNGGLRIHDISDPLIPREVGAFVPAAAPGARVPATQINEVYVDENGIVYCADRHAGGLYILELDL
ncbi:LVIVD repeat-containing protein [Ancylobacter sp.]|uniref:LVIVD repeat-containing protein n=1 Tax=Ancylobacter sp. TaxID=1872567 RepID=UPI003C7CDC8B